MTFPLSDQPVLGEWFIFVEMQGHVYNKSFEVQKYGKSEKSDLGEVTDPRMAQVIRGRMAGAVYIEGWI